MSQQQVNKKMIVCLRKNLRSIALTGKDVTENTEHINDIKKLSLIQKYVMKTRGLHIFS